MSKKRMEDVLFDMHETILNLVLWDADGDLSHDEKVALQQLLAIARFNITLLRAAKEVVRQYGANGPLCAKAVKELEALLEENG